MSNPYMPIDASENQSIWIKLKEIRFLKVAVLVLWFWIFDQRCYNLFLRACKCNSLVAKILGGLFGIIAAVWLFLITDQKIICAIIGYYITGCVETPPAYSKFVMFCIAIKKFFDAMKETIDYLDGTTAKEEEERRKEAETRQREEKERAEKKRKEEKKKRDAKETKRRNREHKRLMNKINTLIAQNAELSGSNGETLAEFRARVAREQRVQIVRVFNDGLTNALDQYDGISLRFDPFKVDQAYRGAEE